MVDKFLPGLVDHCICMDGACIVQAPNWDIVYEQSYTGPQIAGLLREIYSAAGGSVHFGAHPLSAYDEIEFVSSDVHLDWVRGCAVGDQTAQAQGFAQMLLRRSEEAQAHGKDRLRVSEDFIGEVEASAVGGWFRVVLEEGSTAAGGRENLAENGGVQEQQSSDQLLQIVEPMIARFNAEHGEMVRCYSSSMPGAVMLRPSSATVNKATGLTYMAELLGLTPAQFCTFGDEFNDNEMHEWAGHSISPVNAKPETKRRAAEVSSLSHEEDFIAEALASFTAPHMDLEGSAKL